ncbi:sigma 54-interacting transcriptional regulator [Vitiosangium sp. GDMCC 1.1324]|uniref:sigma 54-interacting transcriptional regulator n=1 Tax=Vitiosangium sp. (strain GDMCC 1.1324) TaxID=2138576 RepID=UPI000D3CEEAF|nr:sigma 54-interacting transcriptional regulator [Vitiosangium sp. GDMCC 1.1324]PTL76840.1 sigma-54-dependent Fis family transcriptional regulator [Vitiosangium sp. GDMCC 1.1324]
MPALLLLSGPSAGLRYEVQAEATIGRSPSCEIPLPEDDQMSRRHARFFVHEGQVRLADLGSRNGTSVNGERIVDEVVLHPGDRVQVGKTTVLVEPLGAAALVGSTPAGASQLPIEEVLPHVGAEAALYSAGAALLGATSEAMVLRCVAEESLHALHADAAAALLGDVKGLLTAAVVGAPSVEVPRDMARAALEHSEQGFSSKALCSPLVASGGSPFGVLYVERSDPPFTEVDGRLAAMLGRLGGEAYAAVRSRAGAQPARVDMVGNSRPFRKVLEQARRAAASAAPVVLSGEPGTGKSLCAHYIHSRSSRALGPLVRVDCRDSASLAEVLFGRSTGQGLPPLSSALLRADGGTLLLLHVEMLPRSLAERLARLLARKTAPARQGGEEPVDFRLIVTTSAPPRVLASRGELEASLLRQLAGLELELPPLRDRRADVPPLFELFAARGARAARKGPPVLTPEARQLLMDYEWPHNVRELELLGERLALVHAGSQIHALGLPPEIQAGSTSPTPLTLQERVARLERDAITEALRTAGGKKIVAARMLGISRPTLDKKIEDYGLTVARRRV